MDKFLQQDIFFFVTTIAVITLTILLGVALVYFIRIGRRLDDIATQLQQGLKDGKTWFKTATKFFDTWFGKRKK